MPPLMAVRLAVDLRPSADGSAVYTRLSVPIALGETDGRIAVSLNAPPPTVEGIIILGWSISRRETQSIHIRMSVSVDKSDRHKELVDVASA